jgi:hypothetical protein
MGASLNPKIIGATVVGLALVAGAYATSGFREPLSAVESPSAITNAEGEAPLPRVSIAVYDQDENGIEDWRDSFVTTEINTLSTPTTTYEAPTTLTGQTGLRLLEGAINSKIYAPFAPNPDEVVTDAVSSVKGRVKMNLLELKDIEIMDEWNNEDVKNYANTLAGVIYKNSVPDIEGEITIVNDILRNEKTERIAELEVLRDVYMRYRDDSLKIPVPKEFSKAHLDLINTYQAIYEDIDGMTKVKEDPLLALLYIRRYDSDVNGMVLAINNLHQAFSEYENLFSPEDPALLFSAFNIKFNLSN